MTIPKATLTALRERAGGLCEDCHTRGDWRGLHPHHDPPKRMGGTKHRYTDEELVLLCGSCHSARHGIREVPS